MAQALGSALCQRLKFPFSAMPHVCFNVVERGVATAEGLDSLFAQLLANPGWSDYNTKASHRKVDQWTFDGDRRAPPSSHLGFLSSLMDGLLDAAQSEVPDDPIVPFQCFVCLYETGEDSYIY